jgi:hypothetical protein
MKIDTSYDAAIQELETLLHLKFQSFSLAIPGVEREGERRRERKEERREETERERRGRELKPSLAYSLDKNRYELRRSNTGTRNAFFYF